ncbi:MAG TPA: hypothetical protein VMZ03_03915 [Chitinophagaceae bacterium]|nr:hypothetical protein [Chitinophagaceae bacterium]
MMKYLLFMLLLSCAGPFKDQQRYEAPVDSSAVDPQPRPDTLKVDSLTFKKY